MRVSPHMRALRQLLFSFLAAVLLISASNARAASQPYISAHQVNFATGNKYLSATDVSLSGPGTPLTFSRTYNSQSSETSLIGYGWAATFTERLIIETSAINLVREDGRYISFKNDGSGNWVNETGGKRSITANAGSYQLKEPNGTVRQFDSNGHLLSITDRNNNVRTYTYSGPLLSSISDNFGRSISFTYTSGQLTGVTSALGTWTYSYLNNNLIKVSKPDGTNIQYIYDNPNLAHSLTGIIDESGTRILTVVYDNQNRVISSAKANDSDKVTIAYPATNMREVTDSLGIKTTYQLDVLHGVAMVGSMTGPGCSSCGSSTNTKYLYDDRLQVMEATDGNGVKTFYAYDAAGNRITETRAFGTPLASTTTKTYDPVTNQVLTITEPSASNPGQNRVTTMTYDPSGNLLTRTISGYSGTTAISAATSYTYNTFGQITSIDGPRTDVNDVLTFAYYPNDPSQGNNRGNLQTVTDALGHTTTYSDYTAFGQAQTVTDPNGIVTTRVYNANGLLLSATTAGLTTSYTYDATGKLQSLTLPDNRKISYSYTPAGQVAQITDSLSNSISYTYDSEGRRTGEEVHDPQNTLTRFAGYGYDEYGHLNKVTLPGNLQETAGYDLVGNLVSTINAAGKETDYQYDALRRLLTVTEAGVAVSRFTYDLHGNQATVTDAKGNVTSSKYDDLNNRIEQISPDTGTTRFTYDAAGNLLTKTDANNTVTTYGYDPLNRVIAVSYGDTSLNVSYTYDEGTNGIGRLTSIRDSSGTTGFQYDQWGNLLSENATINGHAFTTSYSYNNNRELIAITYPSGRVIAYQRDAAGLVTTVTSTYQGQTTTISRDIAHLPFGPITAMTLGNGLGITASFDQQYRLTASKAGNLINKTYSYNAANQVTSIGDLLDSSRSQTFTYDDPGRLLTAQGIYGTFGYSYDAVGNRLSETKDGVTTTYQYTTGTNRLAQLQGVDTASYSYDPAGNPLAKGNQAYTWNQDNRLAAVKVDATTAGQYLYNYRGLRTITTAAGTTTLALYDRGGNLVAEADAQGGLLREYVYLDNQRLALFDYSVLPEFAINVSDSTGAALAGVPAYAYDEQGQYTGIHNATDSQGKVVFNREDFGEGAYRFRIDYLGRQLWTDAVVVRTSRGVSLVVQEAPVTVTIKLLGTAQAGVTTYVFSESGEYLGLSAVTGSDGTISLLLPEGGQYTFRADLLGNHYASQLTTIAAAGTTVTVDPGGGTLTLQVTDDDGTPLPGLKTTLYSETGDYLGVTQTGDTQGKVSYTLPTGRYKVRAEYLGSFFWSEVIAISADLNTALVIPHRDVKITVASQYTGTTTPLASVPCSLFTPAGVELGLQITSNASGEAVFHLPQQPYRIRASYLGQQFWSADTTWQNTTIAIACGQAEIKVTANGAPLGGVTVHGYNSNNQDTGIAAVTDTQGQVLFTLPEADYRFLAEQDGHSFWSGTITVTPDQHSQTAISTGGGLFVLTASDDHGQGLAGVKTTLASATGQSLNQTVYTSPTGEATYNLADGSYRINVEYLGYIYTTDPFTIPAIDHQALVIPRQAHTVSVFRTYQGDHQPVANVDVTLATPDGTPLGLSVTTGADGQATLALPLQSYILQARYLGQTYACEPFTTADPVILIAEGMAKVVLTKDGSPLAGTQVTAISDTDPDHPLSATTGVDGTVFFRLPAGSYTFKATDGGITYQGIGTVVADSEQEIDLRLGTESLAFTVRKDAATVLPGLTCTLCDSAGNPLGRTAITDSRGIATFAVTPGNYLIKVAYLGFDFTSEPIHTPETLAASLLIAHHDLAIRILKDQTGSGGDPVAGQRCYLYAENEETGTATGLAADSDANGMVHFQVPDRSYRGVALFMEKEFVSVAQADGQQLLTIALGTLTATIRDSEGNIAGAEVALFTAGGVSLNQSMTTGTDGQVRFVLPAADYKLRVTHAKLAAKTKGKKEKPGNKHWSGVIHTQAFTDTAVLLGSGSTLSRINDPHPDRWDGTPPVYAPQLALASGSLAGMLTSPQSSGVISQVFYYLNDHLGTPLLIVDQAGAIVWQGDYQPFGQVREVVSQQANRFRFPGQYFDTETGLHYNWNRFYDPGTGRYLSADPIGLVGGMNLYAYVSGNPVNFVDPLGEFQFGNRPLGNLDREYIISNGSNANVLHENGFYSNGENVGYFQEGIRPDNASNLNRYTMFGYEYNDAIMRQAVENLRNSGNWLSNNSPNPNGYDLYSHNCQDFADALRKEYHRLGGVIYPDPGHPSFKLPDINTAIQQMH